MLKKITGCESLRHTCDKRRIGAQALDVYLHDVQPHVIVKKTGEWAGNISYCPYCGADIEKEERP